VENVLKHYSSEFFNGRHIDTLQKTIAAQIHYHEQEFTKAIRLAETVMDIAQRLDFKIFVLLNSGVLSRIYHQLQMEKQKKDAMSKMVLIRDSTSFKQAVPAFDHI
jgi:hypothetical protein